MEFKITEKKENNLLDRIEVTGEVVFQGAVPGRLEIAKKVASTEGATEGLVLVKNIKTMNGFGKSTFSAFIYKDEDSMKKIEYGFMLNRGKPKAAAGEKAAA